MGRGACFSGGGRRGKTGRSAVNRPLFLPTGVLVGFDGIWRWSRVTSAAGPGPDAPSCSSYQRLEVVARIAVVRRRVAAQLVGVHRPEARGRGQRLVDQVQRAVGVEAELRTLVSAMMMLRVRAQVGRRGVQGDGGVARRWRFRRRSCPCLEDLGQGPRRSSSGACSKEMFSSWSPCSALVAGGENRLRQLGGEQSGRQRCRRPRRCPDSPSSPNRSGSAHHGFDGQRFEALDDEAAPRTCSRSSGDDAFPVDAGQLVRDDVAEPVEPEVGQLGQDLALARDRVGQDDVEGRQAVAGDDQQRVGVDGVDVADLAAAEELQAFDGRFEEGVGHGSDQRE